MLLDLTKGICTTEQYQAWKFPGGEIHFKFIEFTDNLEDFQILTRLNSSDDIIFLMLVVDTIKKDYNRPFISLSIPYMPYQQADRNFKTGECFSLKTIANLINSMNLDQVFIYDSHSDVSLGLINNSISIDNYNFIKKVLSDINDENIIICSTDAGSFKKIFKLCEKLDYHGDIVTCLKSRNHETNEITTIVPEFDETKPVLIIDDIALGSKTFLNIRRQIKNKQVYLAVSHGVFNENIDKLETDFTKIYTTNSRRDISVSENIKIFDIFKEIIKNDK